MATEIRVPTLGESVTEATIGQWFKQPGEAISIDEPLVELETDKVTVEVPSPVVGVMGDIIVGEGETVEVGALLGSINEGAAAPAAAPAKKSEPAAPAPQGNGDMPPAPSASRLMNESGVAATEVAGTGKRGQVLKEDVLRALEDVAKQPAAPIVPRTDPATDDGVREKRVKMTRLRQTIARRLKDAQNNAAMLTTFNDVDMGAVMDLRKEYKELFEKKHGTRLGFMGFFIKAATQALQEIPTVNAEIDGGDIIYKNYCHIGVAVGTDRGLVVPVIRDAQDMSIATVEKNHHQLRPRSPRRQTGYRRYDGRNIYHHQRRRLRVSHVNANSECAAVRHSWHAQNRTAPGGPWRRGGDSPDDVFGIVL